MKTDALKEKGLTQEQIDFVMAENGKDIKALQKSISDLTAERDNYKTQFESAQGTLKSFEGVDLESIKKELADWKKKAEDTERDYAARLSARDFDDALRAEMETIKFTSDAAKRAVISEIKDAGLSMKDGKILGFGDLISQIRERDASAFVDEKKAGLEQNKAKFTSAMNTGSEQATAFEKMSVAEKMAYANAHGDSPEVRAWLNK